MQAGGKQRVLPLTLLETRSRRGRDVPPADCLDLNSCPHTKRGRKRGACGAKRPGADVGGRPRKQKRTIQPHQGFQPGHPFYGPSADTKENLERFEARARAAAEDNPYLQDLTLAYNKVLQENETLKVSCL